MHPHLFLTDDSGKREDTRNTKSSAVRTRTRRGTRLDFCEVLAWNRVAKTTRWRSGAQVYTTFA
jgi:hypothetical protein